MFLGGNTIDKMSDQDAFSCNRKPWLSLNYKLSGQWQQSSLFPLIPPEIKRQWQKRGKGKNPSRQREEEEEVKAHKETEGNTSLEAGKLPDGGRSAYPGKEKVRSPKEAAQKQAGVSTRTQYTLEKWPRLESGSAVEEFAGDMRGTQNRLVHLKASVPPTSNH